MPKQSLTAPPVVDYIRWAPAHGVPAIEADEAALAQGWALCYLALVLWVGSLLYRSGRLF